MAQILSSVYESLTELETIHTILQDPHMPARPCIVELGAHHGNDTAILYRSGRSTPRLYLAVEALPANAQILRERFAGYTHLFVHEYAIASHTGRMSLHVSEGGGEGSSSLLEPTEHLNVYPDITFPSTIEVPTITLDDLMKKYLFTHIDILWCDIQGAERAMINGGKTALGRAKYLLIEAPVQSYYRGQATRQELLALLSRDWLPLHEWPSADNNILLKNKKFP